ncbi:hypothetical protein [Streptomyces sp. NPDC007369]|uniref:hypothetical protein n=1 Tax=Streptomyces sp. NPDC007369 TaxID=3154589 RepID=UPI003401E781
MSRTSRTLRLVLFTASASLTAGGVLLPTGAIAAPAAPHPVIATADRDGGDREDAQGEDGNVGEEDNGSETGSQPTDSGSTDSGSQPTDSGSQPTGSVEGGEQSAPQGDSGSGVVPESACNDPKQLPGLCVNGKPLPKGDGSVKVPQGSVLCLGIDTPEQCADRQKPVVKSPTGSSTVELAV